MTSTWWAIKTQNTVLQMTDYLLDSVCREDLKTGGGNSVVYSKPGGLISNAELEELLAVPEWSLVAEQLKEERRAGGPGRLLHKVPLTQIRFKF